MAKYTFATDENLGGVVDPNFKVFCEWSPKTPIKDVDRVTKDVCGHMFSKICGFQFTSTLQEIYRKPNQAREWPIEYPIIQVVYCPKTRANHNRNERGLSGWYIWQHVGRAEKMIFSIHDTFAYYGFDIAKFFQSDVFERYLPLFEKQITTAYQQQVIPFLETLDDVGGGHYSKREASFFAKCVYDSVIPHDAKPPRIEDVLKTDLERPDEKKAKLAYNGDATYQLKNKMFESGHGYPDYQFNTIADLESFLSMAYTEYDLSDREKLVFWDKNGKELKIAHASILNNGLNFTFD